MKRRSGSRGIGFSGQYTHTDTRTDPDTVTTGPQELSYDYEEFEGYSIDSYYARKKRGELLPMTPWMQYQGVGTASGAYAWVDTRDGLGVRLDGYNRLESDSALPTTKWNISKSEIENVANAYDPHMYVQAAAARLYSKGWDALTFAAELNKTAALFVRTVTRLKHYILTGQIEKMWLEGRYGWRLLMYDIKDISELLNNIDDQRKRFKERCGATESYTETDSYTAEWTSSHHVLYSSTTWKIGLRGNVVADFEPPEIAVNPVTTAWELIPWSFVIDWVVSVGTTLEALSFLALQSNYTAAGGILVTGKRTCSVGTPYNIGQYFQIDECSYDATFDATYTLRRPMSVSLIPQINLNLDALKVLDLVALFLQAVRR